MHVITETSAPSICRGIVKGPKIQTCPSASSRRGRTAPGVAGGEFDGGGMDQRAVYIAKTQRNRGIGLLRFGINFNRGGMTNNRLLSFIQWAAPSGAFAWTQRCVLIKNNSAAKLDFVYVVLQRNMQRKNHKKKSTELQGQHPIDPRRFGNVLRAGWYGSRPLHFSQEHIVAHFGVDGEAEAEDLLFW